jgi:hypothetical protein
MGYKFNPFTGTFDDAGTPGAGTPGGSTTQVQFNDGGVFGGDVDLTWNKTTNVLTVGGDVNLNDGGAFTTTIQTITPTANRTISFPNATGTLALVAGGSGQVLWNNAGVNAGISTLTYDGSILTTAGRFVNSYNATASAPAKAFTGTWFTGGTSTTTKPHVLIEPTGATSTAWSTSGTGLGVNAASGFAGNLLDLQVNATTKFRIDNQGALNGNNGTYLISADGIVSAQRFTGTSGKTVLYDSGGFPGLALANNSNIYWESGGTVIGSRNVGFVRSASGQIGINDGTNGSTNWRDLIVRNVCTAATTVAGLPAAATAGAGARAFVTDASATTFLSTVAGGGANKVPVVSDGTNWLIG